MTCTIVRLQADQGDALVKAIAALNAGRKLLSGDENAGLAGGEF
ncbi:hypothetical protein [Candidatus Pyrohabitans sp.]